MVTGKEAEGTVEESLGPRRLGLCKARRPREGPWVGEKSGVKCFPHKCDDLCLVPSTCVKDRAC